MPAAPGDPLVQSYNDVPYTSAPDPARHPDRLATIGTLMGVDVALVATSRVLELGCGDGANLVAIAATLPDATFVGFDFAAVPVARAQQMVRELALSNVRIHELDLRAVPADFGTFDYIIAHGLYSWIPADVRAAVMPLIARHLAPNGIALVSYNALPGSHLRSVVRDMLLYHTRHVAGKADKVSAARTLLELVGTAVDDDTPAHQAMRAEVRSALEGSDASLAHDDLSEPNQPFHFHEVIADAGRAGLTFLAEARLDAGLAHHVAPQVQQALARLDRLTREQYVDFVHFRHFRESLLCHASVRASFSLQSARVRGLYALPSLALRRAASPSAGGADRLHVTDPFEHYLLSRWPQSVAIAELADSDVSRSGNVHRVTGATAFDERIVALHAAGRVDLRAYPVNVAAEAGERPLAFGAARFINREHDVIPSLYHEALRYSDPVARKLLAVLDGTRTRAELGAAVGGPFAGATGRAQLDRALRVLASKALLVEQR
ncbi:MAG TPA: methyltransferase regulatory domain-containing protein [Casimicrobiaceae bacterium]|nr:methyltransferase regulatory domain-containing protein [Casimicrobiaceae bacterium]